MSGSLGIAGSGGEWWRRSTQSDWSSGCSASAGPGSCKKPAAAGFSAWSEAHGIGHLRDVGPVHVAAWVEELQLRMAAPSVKLHLAGIRMLFDWLVLGQIIPTNPASAVRGPKHSARKGKTPVLTATEARALIALMIYTFACVGAVLRMRTGDVFNPGRR